MRFGYFPSWTQSLSAKTLRTDIIAGLIVGILIVPQSLGYALVAGLPPVYGLYASIVPTLVYAWFGASPVLAVGPVAITAIMTAQALASLNPSSEAEYISLVMALTFLTGLLLLAARLAKLGWVMQFISRGVIAGFISATALLIVLSQLSYLSGLPLDSKTVVAVISSLPRALPHLHLPTLVVGTAALLVLLFNRYLLSRLLSPRLPASQRRWLQAWIKVFPLVVVVTAIISSWQLQLVHQGVAIIGSVPQGLPNLQLPLVSARQLIQLLPAAALIALISFISSAAVGKHYARLRDEVYPINQELASLGIANLIGSFFQSFAVSGGFSRTAVNVDAGANSPIASIASVAVMVAALVWVGDWLAPLPYAVLGAAIIAAVVGMVDITTLKKAWYRDPIDAACYLVTAVAVLIFGLNIGLVIGLLFSFASLIWQSSQPHIAIVGQIPDTGHFRNINRHSVITFSELLILRIDEHLFFGNALSVRERIDEALEQFPDAKHLLLVLSAVNHIDLTAQEMLVNLNRDLSHHGRYLHYAEIKGPVMDVIDSTPVIMELSGQVFLSTKIAVDTINNLTNPAPDLAP